ncbi:hypothetical protein N0V88_007385 [Collariella sp. IMI 366227]|nr:hypothetical protein N0V88_007385 [Collariella sp. IMI 366227]
MNTTITYPEDLPLGTSLPPGDPHGVSVHLPKWADTVGWASREPRVLDAMKTGYPRFFIPRVVDQLAMRLIGMVYSEMVKKGSDEKGLLETTKHQLAMLLDTHRHAQMCGQALSMWEAANERPSNIKVHAITWDGTITKLRDGLFKELAPANKIGAEDIFLISYPTKFGVAAKAFWQHTGFGISSRRATHWLEHAPFLSTSIISSPPLIPVVTPLDIDRAKAELKARIAAGFCDPSSNLTISPSDVFLFPTGMTAITEVASTIKSFRKTTPSTLHRVAVFGFVSLPLHPSPQQTN